MKIKRSIIIILILVLATAVYAYTQLTPNPGHTAEEIYIYIEGVSMTLQEAINIGLFDCDVNIGISSVNLTLGHNVGKITANIGGNIKDFQQALSDKSLFLVSPGTSSTSVAGITSGHSSRPWLAKSSRSRNAYAYRCHKYAGWLPAPPEDVGADRPSCVGRGRS